MRWNDSHSTAGYMRTVRWSVCARRESSICCSGNSSSGLGWYNNDSTCGDMGTVGLGVSTRFCVDTVGSVSSCSSKNRRNLTVIRLESDLVDVVKVCHCLA